MYEKDYYIDLDAIAKICEILNEEDNSDSREINIFKYDIAKLCIDRVLSEYDDDGDDDELKKFKPKKTTTSFNIAFNTLLRYKIIKEHYEK